MSSSLVILSVLTLSARTAMASDAVVAHCDVPNGNDFPIVSVYAENNEISKVVISENAWGRNVTRTLNVCQIDGANTVTCQDVAWTNGMSAKIELANEKVATVDLYTAPVNPELIVSYVCKAR